MTKIIVFTEKEAEAICYDREVVFVDSNGVKTIFMNEARYEKRCKEKYWSD